MSTPSDDEPAEVDPVEFLRATLELSPEDATKAREDAAEKMKQGLSTDE